MLENNYAYIRISQFQNDTGNELTKTIKSLKEKHKINGAILDLRNNPGGILDSSVQIADAFLNKDKLKYEGIIVYTKGRIGAQIKEQAHSKDILNNAPMVVMINGGSASASEIVAGALQDHGRAIIVGPEPSFGKGSVQTILPLKDKRGLKLTTALYYTPSGRSIQATGIKPDITIENIRLPEIKKDKDNDINGLYLRETDLQGHLENGTLKAAPDTTKGKESKEKQKELPLIYADYQLYQALNILKGIATTRN
jgi:carboxyl-terminal processing protease